jgi:zinc transport system substrate-binding protein
MIMGVLKHKIIRGLLALLLTTAGFMGVAEAKTLRVGITLHPYYSFVANIIKDRGTVVPLIGPDSNPHNYTPRPDDMKRALEMDVVVVNGIGHDEFAFSIIKAAGVQGKLPLIYANADVALIPIASDAGNAKVVNPHTFVSTTAATQQIYTIARELGKLDPENAAFFRANAQAYALKIRKLKAEFMSQLTALDAATFRCATMHGAYGYLMQEFGLQVSAVIEPRHGVEPTARQLADTIDRIRKANVNVLFAEKFFASALSNTIKEATGVQMYSFSHMSSGAYTPELFEQETQANLQTLLAAMKSVAQKR